MEFIFNKFLDLLFPPSCLTCRKFVLTNEKICGDCWKDLSFIASPLCHTCGRPFDFKIAEELICGACIKTPPNYEFARHILKFNEHSKKLIHRFKYYDHTYLADFFAKIAFNNFKELFTDIDYMIPVPMYKLKRLFRKYNQAGVLGVALSKVTAIPLLQDALYKTRWTKPQASLSKSLRAENLRKSFLIKDPEKVLGKKILLLDDVLTTGNTVHECTKLLIKHGAGEVRVFTPVAVC